MSEDAFTIEPMTERAAREMLSWQYQPPYDFYNADVESLEEDVAEALEGGQYSVSDRRGEIIGFFAFGECARVPGGHRAGAYRGENVVDIGLGMRPDLTGQGRGFPFMQAVIGFTERSFRPRSLRLTVATFNRRAIAVYERVGFAVGPCFMSETPGGLTEFVVMTRDVSTPRGVQEP